MFRNSFLSLLSIVIFLFFTVTGISATDYYQRQSGNWNQASTWTTDNSSWNPTVNVGTYPQAGDNVYLKNNGNTATINLTADAICANLYFEGSESGCIAMGNYNLTVTGNWSVNWSSGATITQGLGYLQINGAISQFNTAKTISNFRIGSAYFSISTAWNVELTVSSNYDYNCFQSTIPAGINAASATKLHRTPCDPILTVTSLSSFGSVCPGSTTSPNSFTITGAALNTSNITVSALAGYTYSTTENGTYSNTLSIPQPGDSLIKVIYVKFSPVVSGLYNGNIVVSGGGASAVNVATSGTGATSVVPSVGSLVISNVTSSSAAFTATITVAGCAETITERGFYYSTTNGFADGAGTKVSETGSFSTGSYTLNATGIASATTYYVKAFATNSNGTTYTSQATFHNIPRTYYSQQPGGNWTSTSTWGTEGCWNTVNNGTYPKAYDNVVLCNEAPVTVNEAGLACNSLTTGDYLGGLVLNYDFKVYGNVSLVNHSYINVGSHQLTIDGNFANTPNGYNARVDYSSGTVSIGGNITVDKNGLEPFNCSGAGWVELTGISQTLTSNTAISIPNLKQPEAGFTVAGTGSVTVSDTFDQNKSSVVPAGIVISVPANTTGIPEKVFQTKGSGLWSDVSNWQYSANKGNSWNNAATAPTAGDSLIELKNGHIIEMDADHNFNRLQIDNGAVLKIDAGKKITVEKNLAVNGTIQLLSDQNGTATLLAPADIAGSGSFVVRQYLGSERNWYLSSPLTDAQTPAGYTIYRYLEPGNNTGYVSPATAFWQTIPVGTVLQPGEGIIVQPTNGLQYVEFTGTALNNGSKTFNLTRTAGKQKEGFNLIGNPYPSYLDWSKAVKTNVESTIWYRTKNNAGFYVYDTYNGVGTNNNQRGTVTNMIPPMQGVWVRVSAGKTTGSVQFTNDMREHETGTNRLKMKAADDNKIIRLSVSNGVSSDEAILYFPSNAENPDSYDAVKMSNGNNAIPEISTQQNNQNLVINGMGLADISGEVPVYFSTGEAGDFTLSLTEWKGFDTQEEICLLDYTSNQTVHLTSSQTYNFSSSPVAAQKRFGLIFKAQQTATGINLPGGSNMIVSVSTDQEIIISQVNAQHADTRVDIFTVSGTLLQSVHPSGTAIIRQKLPAKGVYLIKITESGTSSVSKIIVQ